MPQPGTLAIRAHAKVNLALAVGPPLPPRGYHPIASWFACIGLHNDLALTRADDGISKWSIRWADDAPRPSPIDWPLEKDLAVRAHRLLEHTLGRSLPVNAVLRKRTPVGAGLGGGSADAAAALTGINALFNLQLPEAQLHQLSTSLGSDIAFFIDPAAQGRPARPAIVTGFGERIERLDPLVAWLTLILPPFGCPTGPVYQAFDRSSPAPLRESHIRALAAANTPLPSAPLFNDLAEPACRVEPRLSSILDSLRTGLAKPVHITGSGSTLFVPAQNEASAQDIAARARVLCPEVVALATPLL